jgi:CubicO group peptidase (beta-lactamase class C family)
MAHKATTFLEQKVLETIGEYGVPALAAAVVWNYGADTASAQHGIRKVDGGGSDPQNRIASSDKFNLGSNSKVVTGYLMTKLIQDQVGNPIVLKWDTTILEVFPDLPTDANNWQQWQWEQQSKHTTVAPLVWQPPYGKATVAQLLSHTAGFLYQPSTDDPWDWMKYTGQSAMNTYSLKGRRYTYVDNAVVDPPPYFPPGTGWIYGGGGIICAAMAEKLTGKTYEQLVQQYVFEPLGMVNSGFGRLYQGYPDWYPADGPIQGPWQHGWDDATRRVEPDTDRMKPGYNWDPRAPVADVAMSAEDMALFLKEQVSDSPIVCTVDARNAAQTTLMTAEMMHVSGGWQVTNTIPVTRIWHNGLNGVSYAEATVQLDSGEAYAAMSNVATLLGAPAVAEMNAVSRYMLATATLWDDSIRDKFVPCDHPCPALILAAPIYGPSSDPQDPYPVLGPGPRMVFARKHDGSVRRATSTDGGTTWSPAAALTDAVSPNADAVSPTIKSPAEREIASSMVPLALPEAEIPINSGLAACISAVGDQCYLFGRRLDSRIWFRRSKDNGTTWERWRAIGDRLFLTGPAAAASADGKIVHVVAVGRDNKLYGTRSITGGDVWNPWVLVNAASGGDGPYTSAPALACSDDGQTLHTFGRGDDRRIWHDHSNDGGTTWRGVHWVPDWDLSDDGKIVEVPTSSPAAATSSDGTAVVVVVRGSNRGMWFNSMTHTDPDSGQANWNTTWQPIGQTVATFTSAPAMAMNDPGDGGVSVVALADDFTLWGSRYHPTPDGVLTWDGWSRLQGLTDDFA